MAVMDALLEVKGLRTQFFLDEGTVKAVDGVDCAVERGKTLVVVGESGSGKSVMARSILQIVEPPGRIVDGQILLHRCISASDSGQRQLETMDLAALDPRSEEIRRIRGKEISMVFQEPMTALSPVHTIGKQMAEIFRLHMPVTKQEAAERSVEMLRRVGIPKPEERVHSYAFQLSGGMRQRAMIAMALCCHPSLVIADEPTTALDVTTQAHIMTLLRHLQAELGMAIMLITHDLGVAAEMADQVAVMYLGQIVETGDVDSIFHDPKHPYTKALLRSIPKIGVKGGQRLDPIPGMVPHPYHRPPGCPFHPRCDQAMSGRCDRMAPAATRVAAGRVVRCLLYGGAEGES